MIGPKKDTKEVIRIMQYFILKGHCLVLNITKKINVREHRRVITTRQSIDTGNIELKIHRTRTNT